MTPIELNHRISQFYYLEARLLDERRYRQWLGLLAEDIVYTLPAHTIAQADPALRGTDDFHSLDHELERPAPDTAPLREENIFQLAIRADRALKANAWAENPAPRTRRVIGNIEVTALEEGDGLDCRSNFLLFYSRHGRDNHTYSGYRHDMLRDVAGELKIARREVILDWNVITAPTVGLFF